MWRRLECASRSIEHCQHPKLKNRLVAEISFSRVRCLAIKDSLTVIRRSVDPQSIQKWLLEELLSRCLSAANLSYHLS